MSKVPIEWIRDFKLRLEGLFAEEKNCKTCQKTRATLGPDDPQIPCHVHRKLRKQMGLTGMR